MVDSAPSRPKRFWPIHFVARNFSMASAAFMRSRMWRCSVGSSLVDAPSTCSWIQRFSSIDGEVGVLDAHGSAVGIAQHAEDVAELHALLATDRRVHAGLEAGEELAVEVPDGEAVERRVEFGVHLRRLGGEGIEVGDEVAAHPVHVDEVRHAHLLADRGLLAVDRVHVGVPLDGGVRHADRGEHVLVEVLGAEQHVVDLLEEQPGLGTLDDAVVVGGADRHGLADAEVGDGARVGGGKARRVRERTHADDDSLARHEARDGTLGADGARVGERDGDAGEVVGRELVVVGLADDLVVGGDEGLEVHLIGALDGGHDQAAAAVLLLHVDREAEVDRTLAKDAGLAVGTGDVRVVHLRQVVGDGADDGVTDDVGEADLAATRATEVAVDDGTVDLEQAGGHLAETRRRGDGERLLHVLDDARADAADRVADRGRCGRGGRRRGCCATGAVGRCGGRRRGSDRGRGAVRRTVAVGDDGRVDAVGRQRGDDRTGRSVVGEEFLPRDAHRVRVGEVLLVHLVDQPGVRSEGGTAGCLLVCHRSEAYWAVPHGKVASCGRLARSVGNDLSVAGDSVPAMLIATWNVNSLKARMPRVEEWLEMVQPDVLCLQETKLSDAQFPAMAFAGLGYETAHHGFGQWNGVAILSKVGISDVVCGFDDGADPDPDSRIIWATCGGVRVVSVYVPNGRALDDDHYQYKLAWLARLREHLDRHHTPDELLVILGDWNIAPSDIDVWDIRKFADSTHVSKPERDALDHIKALGARRHLPRPLPRPRALQLLGLPGRRLPPEAGHAHRLSPVERRAGLAQPQRSRRPERPQGHQALRPRSGARVVRCAASRERGQFMSDTEPAEGDPTFRSPRVDRLHQLPPTERRVAMRRLASAGREVIELMSSSNATAEELESAASSLEAVVELLRGHSSGSAYEGVAEMANAGDLLRERRRMVEEGDVEAWAQFDYSPFIGLANPMSPPMRLAYEGDRVVCDVTFGSAYEGPPACVHGGYVAAAFDEVLGAAQSLSGEQGMTARLVTNYRSPTPLHEPLRIEAWLDRREGRKIFVQGRMTAGDRLTAEAEGLFIAFDPEKFMQLIEARADMTSKRHS